MTEPATSRTLWLTAFLLVVGIAAAVWGPRLWERRLYRQAEALTGVGSRVLDGTVTEARRRIDPGRTS
ncbi:MAG TPA: hypothetical protein VIX13_02185, partial [Candidatus Eisenbacteria bacterium]